MRLREDYFQLSDEVKLYYEITGEGHKKVVLINGLSSTLRWYDKFIEYFQTNHPSEFQFLAFDNRCCGKSEAPPMKQTTTLLANDCLKLISHVGWEEERIHVYGMSMGGMIAQELAILLHENKRLQSLYLSVTAHQLYPIKLTIFSMWFYNLVLPPFTTKRPVKKLVRDIVNNGFSHKYLKEKNQDGRSNYEIEIEKRKRDWDILMCWKIETLSSQINAVITHSFSKQKCSILSKSEIPICCQISNYDEIISPKRQRMLAKRLNSSTLVLDAGHVTHSSLLPLLFQSFYDNHLISYSSNSTFSNKNGADDDDDEEERSGDAKLDEDGRTPHLSDNPKKNTNEKYEIEID